MIYMSGEGIKIVILETGNLEEIKKDRPAKTPDGSVLIAWTPDPVWLADKILECDGDVGKILKLMDESIKRPQKEAITYHKPFVKKFKKDK
jgi:hypothetical protein